MPNRLKGIVVSKRHGLPYLSATQMLDLRPTPRRYLALEDSIRAGLAVGDGAILVTRSGTVGRTTVTHHLHRGAVVSDDLLRVRPLDANDWGWIYAYLRTPSAQQMMRSLHYGHMIKHLEPAHLEALPMPVLTSEQKLHFQVGMRRMLDLRNRSYDQLIHAEDIFGRAVGIETFHPQESGPSFLASSGAIAVGRRRLEATYYSSAAANVLRHFSSMGLDTDPLDTFAERVFWGARFSRVFGDGGVPYFSADDLWTLNPSPKKHILLDHDGAADLARYRVQAGWLLMACSGQVYGLNGSVDLATDKLSRSFLSHDLIRIIPNPDVRPGYLLVALGHPVFGRPLVIRNAYGSSIPHLDPDDVATVPIVRLGSEVENAIADASELAVRFREDADELENSLTAEAEALIERFLSEGAA